MTQRELTLIEIDYRQVPNSKTKKRWDRRKIRSKNQAIKKVLMVIDRNDLSRDTVVEAVKKHFYRPLSKTTVEVVDYRSVESDEKPIITMNRCLR